MLLGALPPAPRFEKQQAALGMFPHLNLFHTLAARGCLQKGEGSGHWQGEEHGEGTHCSPCPRPSNDAEEGSPPRPKATPWWWHPALPPGL